MRNGMKLYRLVEVEFSGNPVKLEAGRYAAANDYGVVLALDVVRTTDAHLIAGETDDAGAAQWWTLGDDWEARSGTVKGGDDAPR
jgi:hypothetical protein